MHNPYDRAQAMKLSQSKKETVVLVLLVFLIPIQWPLWLSYSVEDMSYPNQLTGKYNFKLYSLLVMQNPLSFQ